MKSIRLLYSIGIFGAILVGCAKEPINLNGTTWVLEHNDVCGSNIFFAQDSVVIFDCEIQEKIYGAYYVEKDSIKIQTVRSEFDHEFPTGSRHKHKSKKISLTLINDSTLLSHSGLSYKKK